MPGFFIDRFANSTKNLQGRKIFPFYRVKSKSHQRTNCGWCGIKNIDFVFFNYIPEPAGVWPRRNSFEHQTCCAGAQRTVNNVAVPRYPTYISGAKENLVRLIL